MSDRDSNILWGIISNYSSAILVMLGTSIFTPVLVRFISPGEYGDFSSILSVYAIIGPLATFGMFNSIRKYLVEVDTFQDQQRIATFSLLFVIILAVVVTVGSVIGLSIAWYGSWISYSMFVGLLLVVFAILFDNLLEYTRSVLYAESREPLAEGLKVVNKYLYYALSILFVYIGRGVIAVLFSFLISAIMTAIIGISIIYDRITLDFGVVVEGYEQFGKKIISFGGWSASSLIIASLMYNADILLVRTLAGSQQAGFYTAALTIAQLFWIFPRGVQSVLFHNISDLHSEENKKEIIQITAKWLKNMFLILTLLGVGIYILAAPFFEIYFGEAYIQSVISFKILMIGTFIFGIGRVFSPIIEATGWIKHNVLIAAVVLVTNIVLNILFIPRYGIEGAAIATSISYSLKVIQYGIVLKYAGYDLVSDFNWMRNILLVSSFFVSLSLLNSSLALNQMRRLIIVPILGLSVFVLLCIALGYIDRESVKEAKAII